MNKFIVLLFILIPCLFFSQSKIDSLMNKLNVCKIDSERINISRDLISEYISANPSKGIELANKNLELSKKINFKIAQGYRNVAYLKFITSDFKESIVNYQLAELEALKEPPSSERNKLLANVYDELASVYSQLQNYSAAINSSEKALNIYSNLKDKEAVTILNYNLGNIYIKKNEYDKAIEQFNKAEKGFLELNSPVYLINVYNSFGSCYYEKGDFKQALSSFQKSYELILELTPNDLSSLAVALENIGEVSCKLGDNKFGLQNSLKASELFRQLNDKTNLYITYENIAKIYSLQNNYQKSNEYFQKYVSLKDSVFDEDTKNTIHEMSIKYESDKKEKENQVLSLENNNKKQIIYFALGGCFLLLGLVFFIFNGYRTKQKANKLLEDKNEIIQQQKTIVEEQHQDITDSIKYAQRIQGAILPPKKMWEKILPNSFVLYMPKDILSGDFYWIEETKDYIYVAAADCTGHGVPGALISIVNFNLLNKAVLEKKLITPSEILDDVNVSLTESLHQTVGESTVRDGMDVTLIAIHKHSNEVLFTGANNPIYIISNDELKQIKGDKFPVGAFVEDQIQKFTTKRFTVEKGDSIYLFSDGFADQFGGDKGKKYKYSPFQERLKEINNLPLTEQSNKMKSEFLNWKGAHEQVDDVLLVGIKII